jgi:hypothetical protein
MHVMVKDNAKQLEFHILPLFRWGMLLACINDVLCTAIFHLSCFTCHLLRFDVSLWLSMYLLLQTMDKPPRGKHSTKGLGKTVPLESEFVKWRDDVVVPCGKPMPSSVRASELLYNEYIVYNTSQVGPIFRTLYFLKNYFQHPCWLIGDWC